MNIATAEKRIGYRFLDRGLAELAFTHRSSLNEMVGDKRDNERLELLGDAVLATIVVAWLYHTLPRGSEGLLASYKAQLVATAACASYLDTLDIAFAFKMSKGDEQRIGQSKRVAASCFEALLGGIFLDGGFEVADKWFLQKFQNELRKGLLLPAVDWKTLIQSWSQRYYKEIPSYQVLEEIGPSHAPTYRIALLVGGKVLGEGVGSSKREAQRAAARAAYRAVGDGR